MLSTVLSLHLPPPSTKSLKYFLSVNSLTFVAIVCFTKCLFSLYLLFFTEKNDSKKQCEVGTILLLFKIWGDLSSKCLVNNPVNVGTQICVLRLHLLPVHIVSAVPWARLCGQKKKGLSVCQRLTGDSFLALGCLLKSLHSGLPGWIPLLPFSEWSPFLYDFISFIHKNSLQWREPLL